MAAKFTLESQKEKKISKMYKIPKIPKFFRQCPFGGTEKMHCAFSESSFINNSFENRST